MFIGNIGDEKVLPGGEADVARTKLFSYVSNMASGRGGHPTDGNDNTDVVMSIGLFVGPDMAVLDLWDRLFAEAFRDVAKRKGEFFLNFFEKS